MPASVAADANVRAVAGAVGINVNAVADDVSLVLPAATAMLASSSWTLYSWSAAEMSIVLSG